jgi:hypothetical protein
MESWFLASGGNTKGPGDPDQNHISRARLEHAQSQAPRSAHQEDAPSRADLARQVCFLDRAFEIRGFETAQLPLIGRKSLCIFREAA